jgi:hypothetical protein
VQRSAAPETRTKKSKMGLEMYAYKTRKQVADYGFKWPKNAVEIQYWRKHPNLHGWMEELYQHKGGTKEFDLETVRLDEADIDALEMAVNEDQLPDTDGFFFGESQPEDKADDLLFIRAARQAMKEGYTVFYMAWW